MGIIGVWGKSTKKNEAEIEVKSLIEKNDFFLQISFFFLEASFPPKSRASLEGRNRYLLLEATARGEFWGWKQIVWAEARKQSRLGEGSLYGWSPVYQDWIWPTMKICCYLYVCNEAVEYKLVKLVTSRTVILPPTVSDLCSEKVDNTHLRGEGSLYSWSPVKLNWIQLFH